MPRRYPIFAKRRSGKISGPGEGREGALGLKTDESGNKFNTITQNATGYVNSFNSIPPSSAPLFVLPWGAPVPVRDYNFLEVLQWPILKCLNTSAGLF